nr:uncharacterized protein LOC127328844 [Lolium perenne]
MAKREVMVAAWRGANAPLPISPALLPHSLHAQDRRCLPIQPPQPGRTALPLPSAGSGRRPYSRSSAPPSSLERRHPPPRPAHSNDAALPIGGIAAASLTHGILLRTRVNTAGRTQDCLLRNRENAAARTREIAAALLKVVQSYPQLRSMRETGWQEFRDARLRRQGLLRTCGT